MPKQRIMKPEFSKISIDSIRAEKLDATDLQNNNKEWSTPEKINVKPYFTAEDTKDAEHINYAAGIPPFLRGPYSTM